MDPAQPVKQHVELPGIVADDGEPFLQAVLGELAQQGVFGGDASMPARGPAAAPVGACR